MGNACCSQQQKLPDMGPQFTPEGLNITPRPQVEEVTPKLLEEEQSVTAITKPPPQFKDQKARQVQSL